MNSWFNDTLAFETLAHFFKPRVHFKTRLEDRLRRKRLNEVEVEDNGERAERRDAGADKEKRWAEKKEEDKMTF